MGRTLAGLQGIRSIEMELADDSFTLVAQTDRPTDGEIARAVVNAGFVPRLGALPSSSHAASVDHSAVPPALAQRLRQGPVLLRVGAAWCAPCRAALSEIWPLVVAPGWQVVDVDADADEPIVHFAGVTAVPDVVAVAADGRILGRLTGQPTVGGLRAWIAGLGGGVSP